MERKYELTKETNNIGFKTLYRIKALRDFANVKAGDLGGFIENEENLSHEGNCWVYGNARVYGNAQVYGNARVYGNAQVCGNARVSDDARVYDYARVSDDAWVYGNAQVCGNAWVYGNARVSDDAWVYGNAQVYGNARVSSNNDYTTISGFGSVNRTTTFFRTEDPNIIKVVCGCFHGTLNEFKAKVIETHKDTKYAKEYLTAIEMVKIHFEIE